MVRVTLAALGMAPSALLWSFLPSRLPLPTTVTQLRCSVTAAGDKARTLLRVGVLLFFNPKLPLSSILGVRVAYLVAAAS